MIKTLKTLAVTLCLAGSISTGYTRTIAQPTMIETIRLESREQSVTVRIGDEIFTTFIYGKYAKPIFYPIYGPGQIEMTRNWPMTADVEGEAHDHPHHKSMWFSHEINGVDFWSEKGGTTKLQQIELLPGDPAAFKTQSAWVRNDNNETVFTDQSVYRFGVDETSRWIDATITILASQGDVTFDDTKEGTFALRTHPDLRLTAKPKDGVQQVFGEALNSNGESGKAIWGKAAKWVRYGGPIDGTPMSIAILDHPTNLRHPTTWHARDYGLVAANPFGLHHFAGQKKGAGAFTIKRGDNLTLRYRVIFLRGIPDQDSMESTFAEFATSR